MGYIQAVTQHLKNSDDMDRLLEWRKVVRQVKVPYEGDPETFRDKVVGLQAEWDRVYNQVCDKDKSVAIIMTGQVGTTVIHDARNVHEIAEAKRPTVLARIETSQEMLDTGSPIIIAAPSKAWAAIQGTSQAEVWNELNERYDNLHGVAVSLPDGVNGALNIVNGEAVSINFKQAQPGSKDVSDIFLMAGAVDDSSVRGRIVQVNTTLRAANDPEINAVLNRLVI